jgi:hypothetical protein
MEAMRESDATFVGTVVSVTLRTDRDWRREVLFDVESTWTSNTVGETTTIDVPYAVWECGRRLQVGERWLIYAMRDDDERLTIDHCDRSHVLADDEPDLAALPDPCEPEVGLRLEVEQSVVRAGDAFTLTLRPRFFMLMEVRAVSITPARAARPDPSCPLPCNRWRSRIPMEALEPGPVDVLVDAFGEGGHCDHGPPALTWAWPRAAIRLEILPASATPPVPVDPTPTRSATPTSQTPAPSSTPFDDGPTPHTMLYLPWGRG